ncbi:MAG: VWA domain-containing protein, partial [Chitinophagaceae bacterium]|nr:VWA domain-containing protein [Chitinophagaceae bacterium]
LEQVQSGLLEDGTAIGMGLATAVDRLRQQKTASKIIVLLTDGVNNAGLIDPLTALELAKTYGIKVYTIGVGTMGNAPFPVQDEWGNTATRSMPVQIDEALLQKIAGETGGQYFRATNNETLQAIYQEIDRLEKTKLDMSTYQQHQEQFRPWLIAALLLLLLETILKLTVLRTLP